MNKTELTREELIENNIGLVHSCAQKLKNRGMEYDDLFQAGCVGLIKASDAFDFDRGVRFSTYAVPVILGEMRRLFRDGGTIKVSRTLKELSLKIGRMREYFGVRHGREPHISEIAKELGVEETQVVEAISAATPPLSLTAGEEDGGGQLDLPVDSPEDALSDMLSLKQVLGQLEPSDRRLVYLRYFGGKTQTQTATELGMTQVQVSRREKKILQGLKTQLDR
ncbi:MAG: sigma-70 family RNA polymerase sigma factor [Oscillospiraceae bacterium]|jgi:RNA polymerase sporulation-specific sigma factor|nr:sigma-70 family RNA polymerase sigma factor [Oscillospiraceae bacterium]